MKQQNAVEDSLMIAAETAGDIFPAVYERYFAACPESRALMDHIDDLVRGKMMEEVLRLVMVPDYGAESQYLDFEVNNHALAYSVKPHMYGNLLQAFKETVAEVLDDRWNESFDQAWSERIAALEAEIARRLPG